MLGSPLFTSFIPRAGAWVRREGLVAPPTYCVLLQGLAPTLLILVVWLSGEQGQRKQTAGKEAERLDHTPKNAC